MGRAALDCTYSGIHAPPPFPGNCSSPSRGAPASRSGTKTGEAPQTRRPLCGWRLPGAAAAPCSSQEPFPFCRELRALTRCPASLRRAARLGCPTAAEHITAHTAAQTHGDTPQDGCAIAGLAVPLHLTSWCFLQTSCHRLSTRLSSVFTSCSHHPQTPPVRAQRVSGQEKQRPSEAFPRS